MTSRSLFLRSIAIFAATSIVLFFGMSMRPNLYDEGLIVTAAMRVLAGEVPHRDFYANYGPAQFYLLAGIFKVFGLSLLAERLYSLLINSLLVVSVFRILLPYCSESVALRTALLTGLWLFGITATSGSPICPALLCNLLGCALIIPVFTGTASGRRLIAAGAVTGLGFLYRYDTGIALLCIDLFMIATAAILDSKVDRPRRFFLTAWPYTAGFTLVVAPPVIYYLSIAPLHAVLHDIVLYPGKYYRAARGLPFPGITWKTFDNIAIYLPLVILCIAFYVSVKGLAKLRSGGDTERSARLQHGFLLTFSLLTAAMFLKGVIRISIPQAFLAIIPSVLMMVILFEKRKTYTHTLQTTILCLVWLSVFCPTWAAIRTLKNLRKDNVSVPQHLAASLRHRTPELDIWCAHLNGVTRGLCFIPDQNHIQAIEFIDDHTKPNQTLFVGLPHHDRIFANDNMTYFATERLPATRWSHFDPDLQNRLDIQTQMVGELEANPPPYILEDSEFDQMIEPNDSSKSSGVTLLDDYIHRNYRSVQVFGELSVWQRVQPTPAL